jgi:SAM-dependent methyltransferase
LRSVRRQPTPGASSSALSDLANIRDGAPERFIPGLMQGELIEVDHLGRYLWASQFAAGRTVLDIACGAGYGCRMLAEAGAASVVGVDISPSLIEAISPSMPENVEVQAGDILALDLPDGGFDLVVCFETIEHVADTAAALSELTRVLADGGLLIVSTPERRASSGSNPHHLHELTGDELAAALSEQFTNVRVFRQEAFLCSAISPEAGFDDAVAADATVRKLTEVHDDLPAYLIALATDHAAPKVTPLLGITTRMDYLAWQKYLDGAAAWAQHQQQQIDELTTRLADLGALQDRLQELEHRRLPLGGDDPFEAERRAHEDARDDEIRVLSERIERADRMWREVQASPSWRLTKPLRTLKHLLKS